MVPPPGEVSETDVVAAVTGEADVDDVEAAGAVEAAAAEAKKGLKAPAAAAAAAEKGCRGSTKWCSPNGGCPAAAAM